MKTQNTYADPNNLVYCKPVVASNGVRVVEVYGAEGILLTLSRSEDIAFVLIQSNDLTPVMVH